MKKLLVLIMVAGMLGCATNGQVPSDTQEQAILTTIEIGGFELGYYVGKSKTDADDIAIADAYALARTGTLSPAEVTTAFQKLKLSRPELAGPLMIILKRMGATVAVDGGLVSLSNIPVKYWDTAAEGYVSGYEFGKIGQKDLKDSAVKAKMPKR